MQIRIRNTARTAVVYLTFLNNKLRLSVVDSHHFDAEPDLDPAFYFYWDPDPTFYFDADPYPTFSFDRLPKMRLVHTYPDPHH